MHNDYSLIEINESEDYNYISNTIINSINNVFKKAFEQKKTKIIVNTSLKHGLPKENINKIAGPVVEAWTQEIFEEINIDSNNINLIEVNLPTRLDIADLILTFKINGKIITVCCDVKSTSYDIPNSGKSPNITSFTRIRDAYTKNPDFIFLIISIKHRLTTKEKANENKLIDGSFDIMDSHVYDLKYLSDRDLSYNPALGSGQIQARNIHNVSLTTRTSYEFCKLLDQKYLNSSKRTKEDWLREAQKNKWIK
ncbi:hypothetical protein [Staphylococcus cohnii]|uniref:hypothetical protein n=1 Tax=Staphylococcaceae TaxID=90964 RepID=UPI003D7DEAC6